MSARIGVVGAGVVSAEYLRNLTRIPDASVVFIADVDSSRAQARAHEYGVPGWGTLDQMLADPSIDIVVNLTIPTAHAEVTARALSAGKHVWSEKPIASTPAEAARLIGLAREHGVRLGVAPDTVLGAGIELARKAVERGEIGQPSSAIAIFQTAGPESWHENPDFLFRPGAGPLLDVGPYYLTVLVRLLGPIGAVSALAATPRSTRTVGSGPRAGESFAVEVPTTVSAILSFESGASGILACSWDSPINRFQVEVSGPIGTVVCADPNHFDGTTRLVRFDGEDVRESERSHFTRGLGVNDMLVSIASGTPNGASAETGAHILAVMSAILESAAEGGRQVEVEPTPGVPGMAFHD